MFFVCYESRATNPEIPIIGPALTIVKPGCMENPGSIKYSGDGVQHKEAQLKPAWDRLDYTMRANEHRQSSLVRHFTITGVSTILSASYDVSIIC